MCEEAIRWPLDFDNLNKGDVIPPERLEEITQERRGTTKYQLMVLALRDRVMDEMEARGKPATVAMIQGSLKVLTDAESTVYNEKQFDQRLKAARRCFGRLKEVQVVNLTEAEKQQHERRLLMQGRVLQAINKTKRGLLVAHKRSTPVIEQQA